MPTSRPQGSRWSNLLLVVLFFAGAFSLVSLVPRSGGAEVPRFPDDRRPGVWAWQPFEDLSDEEIAAQVEFLREQNVGTVYLSIDRYADLHDSRPSPRDTVELRAFSARLARVVSTFKAGGLSVEALFGNMEWGNASHRYLPLALTQFVLDYNARAPQAERIDGIHVDLEPYAQPGFDEHEAQVLDEFLTTTEAIAGRVKAGSGLRLGFSIPFWLVDGRAGELPALTRGSATKTVGAHLLDILGRRGGETYVAVMAYRNTPHGENGTIAITRPTLAYLRDHDLPVGVVIGQETAPTDPPHITFAALGRIALTTAGIQIIDAFRGDPRVRGLAIHDLRSYQSLEPEPMGRPPGLLELSPGRLTPVE